MSGYHWNNSGVTADTGKIVEKETNRECRFPHAHFWIIRVMESKPQSLRRSPLPI
jgi:hypothetical protein